MKIHIKKDFKNDYISREAGEKLRQIILQSNEAIELNFQDIIIASASFLDEGIAKLIDENFQIPLTITHMHYMDQKLLSQVCQARGFSKYNISEMK